MKRPHPDMLLARRRLLKMGALACASPLVTVKAVHALAANTSTAGFGLPASTGIMATGWENYAAILARIQAPTFPDRDFPITQFGAIAGPDHDAGAAIEKAISACHAAGGGRVLVPAGTFFTGPIVLKSHVNLHLMEGAVLKFSTDPAQYPNVFTRWEGIECMNHSPLIYAFEQENIALTGKGILDGQASALNWWAWKTTQVPAQKALIAMGEQGTPVAQRIFGQGHYLRPNFVQFYRCRDILIEDIHIRNSPMWELHPVLSRNITVRGVTIDSHGPNNDGCDPESCHDILIDNCEFNTGDDCIAIKSGKNNDGRRVNVATENIVVRNSRFKDGHGGVVLGSECSGHIRNVFVENCDMDSPHLDRALRFKDNAERGGILENVFMRNVTVGRVGESVLTIDMLYEEGAKGSHPAVVRNVQISNVSSIASPRVMYIVAYPGAVIDRIKFVDCTFRGVESAEVIATSGSIEFHNVTIEPRIKPRSKSTRGAIG